MAGGQVAGSGKIRVLHLVGSATSELLGELSRLYAADCLAATADPSRYEPVVAYVTPDGKWRFLSDLADASLQAAEPVPLADAAARIASLGIDVAVPQMFCIPGMTHYRALLDLLAIPYVGNRPDVMAVAAHKARTRAIVAAAGVKVPRGEVVGRGDRPTLEPPVVVKPVDSDNSEGVTLVRDRAGYAPALDAALAHSGQALVEEYVELGREVRCGVLELDGALVGLPLEEYDVDPDRKPIRGYDDKLAHDDGGDLYLVAKDARAWIVDPADPLTARVQAVARDCHRALGCRHYGLFDFRVDPDGQPWFLEAGLYCSFASKSVVVMMADAAGMGVRDLFDAMVGEALGGAAGTSAHDAGIPGADAASPGGVGSAVRADVAGVFDHSEGASR